MRGAKRPRCRRCEAGACARSWPQTCRWASWALERSSLAPWPRPSPIQSWKAWASRSGHTRPRRSGPCGRPRADSRACEDRTSTAALMREAITCNQRRSVAITRNHMQCLTSPSSCGAVATTTEVEDAVALAPGRGAAGANLDPRLRESVLRLVPRPRRRDGHISVCHVRVMDEHRQWRLSIHLRMIVQARDEFRVWQAHEAAHSLHHVKEELKTVVVL